LVWLHAFSGPPGRGLPLSSAVRLALPIRGRFFMEAMRPCFVGLEAQPPKSKVELPSEADPHRTGGAASSSHKHTFPVARISSLTRRTAPSSIGHLDLMTPDSPRGRR
jgi:hypothetical protein